jgi:uncharacterized membrane protein YpjA
MPMKSYLILLLGVILAAGATIATAFALSGGVMPGLWAVALVVLVAVAARGLAWRR